MRAVFVSMVLALGCEADTRGLELLQPTPDAGEAGCRQASPSVTTGVLEGLPSFTLAAGVEVMDGVVYLNRRANVTALPQVVAFDPARARQEEVTPPDAEGYLIDARDGALLLVAQAVEDTYGGLYHWRGAGDATLVTEVDRSEIFNAFSEVYWGRAFDLVDRESLIWHHRTGFWRWHSDRGLEAIEQNGYAEPTMQEGRIVWAAQREDHARILMSVIGRSEPITIAIGDVAWPALSTDNVFFVDRGALMRFEIGTRSTKELHPGPCGPPYADGDRAVAACGPGDEWPVPGSMIVYWDGVRAHELFDDGGYHFAPRLDRGRIAWIRYRSPEVVCQPPRDTSAGEIRFWDPDLPEPLFLGEVGAPCLCCGAMWPPAVLELEGEVAAWNYARPDGREESAIGWARIQRREVCSP